MTLVAFAKAFWNASAGYLIVAHVILPIRVRAVRRPVWSPAAATRNWHCGQTAVTDPKCR